MTIQSLRQASYLAPAAWVLIAAVFLLDLALPSNINIISLYLVAVLLGVMFYERNDVLLLTVVTTALTLIAIVFKLEQTSFENILIDRFPVLVGLWAAAYFVIRFIALKNEEEHQQEKFKALFSHATNGILVTNRSGVITLANPSVETLFGYKSGGMVGLTVEALIPRRLTERHLQHRQNFSLNPHARAMGIGLNLYGMRADGSEFPVEVSLSPFKTRTGEFTVAFIVDNTYRKNYENSILEKSKELVDLAGQLTELNETLEVKVHQRTQELEQAKNDLASALSKERELGELKSRFVSMASHEFRTPLSAVLSSASLIQSYADRQDLASIKKHTERIKNAVNGLNTILTEFLSLGKLEEGLIRPKLGMVHVLESVHDVSNEMKSLFRSGQTLLHTHEGPEEVRIDAGLLKNILINLISNAIKYSPENAPITINSSVDEKVFRLSIRDRGIGIPEAEQRHLFDRFFRATNAANIHGTGLGLYIVRRYVEMLDGKIGFESAENQGSEFWVQFPAKREEQKG